MTNFPCVMKRLLLLFALAAVLLCSCNNKQDNNTAKDGLSLVKEDYAALVAKYPEAKGYFVEAQFTLNTDIDGATTPKPVSLTTICYRYVSGQSHLYRLEHDLVSGKSSATELLADAPWVGDRTIDENGFNAIGISVETAIGNAKSKAAGSDGIKTRFITLRHPLYGGQDSHGQPTFWENPQYVVGGTKSRNEHVFVDAVNGKVTIKTDYQEGSAGSTEALFSDFARILETYDTNRKLGFELNLYERMYKVEYTLNTPVNGNYYEYIYPTQTTYCFYAPSSIVSSGRNLDIRAGRDISVEESTLVYNETTLNSPLSVRCLDADTMDALISVEDAIYQLVEVQKKDSDASSVVLEWPQGAQKPVYNFVGTETISIAATK